METFLDYVVKGLVDRPDAVTISSVDRNGLTVYELRVHPTDMGKIIGRQGATINAIRALLLVGSAKRGLRCTLEVIDEEGHTRPPANAEGAPAEPGDLPPRRDDVEGGAAPRSASSMAGRGYGGGGGRGPRRPGSGGPGGGGRGPRRPGGGGGGSPRGGGRGYGGGGGGRGYGGGTGGSGGGGYGGGMPREGHSQGGGY